MSVSVDLAYPTHVTRGSVKLLPWIFMSVFAPMETHVHSNHQKILSVSVYVAIGAGGIAFLLAVCIIAVLLCYCCHSKQGKYIPDKPDHHEMYCADGIGTIGIGQRRWRH